ncbi:MAG: prenyltransferase/squalene oxidase repeat-containing protein [Pirellulales bacterium]
MAVPNPDHPQQQRPQSAANSGASSPPGGRGPGGNRPIPLKPRARGDLPEEDEADEELEDESDDLRDILRNAPAWLVSTVFHMVLLIVLGLLAVGSRVRNDDLDVEGGYADDLGAQLENADDLATSSEIQDITDQPQAAPVDLPPVEDPLVTPPAIENLELTPALGDIEPSGSAVPGADIALALSGRQRGSREGLLHKYGGTKGTESAVELGLAWLAVQQRDDGSWSLRGPYPDGGRGENTAAATAMALLAFQGHGDTHRGGKYMKVVASGWNALLKMQKKDGSFMGQMTEPLQQLYTHGQCTIAVCEAYGMTYDSLFRSPAERAVAYAVSAQDPEKGGWRYEPRRDSDTSVTGWFMMALQSARMAKLKVPDKSLREITRYLDSAAMDDGKRYGYWGYAGSTPAMCAEGLLCRQYLGWQRDDPRLVAGAENLLKEPVNYAGNLTTDVYYWYYATQVAHHMEGEIWQQWNKTMREQIPAHQVKEGAQAGSWDPNTDKWGGEGGRLYVTCLSLYNLEVYYRHLPIYAGYDAINALPKVPPAEEGTEDKAPDAAIPEGSAPGTSPAETAPKEAAPPAAKAPAVPGGNDGKAANPDDAKN